MSTQQQHFLRRGRRYAIGDYSSAYTLISNLNINLVAYWKMEELTGQTRLDSTTNGNNLPQVGTVVQAGGRIGFSASSNGGSAALETSSTNFNTFWPVIQPGDSFTISSWLLWVAIPGTGFHGVISHWGPTNAIISYFLWFPNNGTLTINFTAANGTSTQSWALSPQPLTATWYHMAFGYDNATQTVWSQWNGSTTRQSFPLVGIFKPTTGTAYFDLMKYNGDNGPCNMFVDETGWWRRTLSTTEIALLYNNNAGITYPFN